MFPASFGLLLTLKMVMGRESFCVCRWWVCTNLKLTKLPVAPQSRRAWAETRLYVSVVSIFTGRYSEVPCVSRVLTDNTGGERDDVGWSRLVRRSISVQTLASSLSHKGQNRTALWLLRSEAQTSGEKKHRKAPRGGVVVRIEGRSTGRRFKEKPENVSSRCTKRSGGLTEYQKSSCFSKTRMMDIANYPLSDIEPISWIALWSAWNIAEPVCYRLLPAVNWMVKSGA